MATYQGILRQSSDYVGVRAVAHRYGVFLKTYNMTQENPTPVNFIDYPRELPLEISWTKFNPKN